MAMSIVACPLCSWQMTGTSTEVLNGFKAHKLLKHGMKPLQWEATSREAAYRMNKPHMIPDDINFSPMYYDRLGNPISMERWGILHADYDYLVIAKDVLVINELPVEISTVWLGIDHNFGRPPPLIFETMVFGPGTPSDLYQDRYSTEEQARQGHQHVLDKLSTIPLQTGSENSDD
jgi:hypothetical protein